MGLLSGSRLASLGELIVSVLTFGIWGFTRWRSHKGSLLGPAIVFTFPVVGVAVLASTFLIGRLRITIWGGGETVSSTQARIDQWNAGIPKIMSNPIGHGIGSAANVLDYHLLDGMEVIDSYFLRVLLDWGVVGFFVFFGIIISAIVYAAKLALKGRFMDRESSFVLPLAIALATWVILKSANAEEGNHPLIFLMMGMITALVYRAKTNAAPVGNSESLASASIARNSQRRP